MLTGNPFSCNFDYFYLDNPTLFLEKEVDYKLIVLATNDYFPLLILLHFFFFSTFTKARIEFAEC